MGLQEEASTRLPPAGASLNLVLLPLLSLKLQRVIFIQQQQPVAGKKKWSVQEDFATDANSCVEKNPLNYC